jgi:hypothetical protein
VRSDDRPEVLLPSAAPPGAPVPFAAVVLGLVGLLVLTSSTVPALLRCRELERACAAGRARVERAEAEVDRLRRELRAAAQAGYLRARETCRLLEHGRDYLSRRDARLRDAP